MVKLASWEWMFTTIASQLVRGLWKFNLIITMIFQGFIKAVLNFFQSGKSCVNNQWHFFFRNFSSDVSKVTWIPSRFSGSGRRTGAWRWLWCHLRAVWWSSFAVQNHGNRSKYQSTLGVPVKMVTKISQQTGKRNDKLKETVLLVIEFAFKNILHHNQSVIMSGEYLQREFSACYTYAESSKVWFNLSCQYFQCSWFSNTVCTNKP